MSTTKAEKFVRLLSAKLNELPHLPFSQAELREKLETAVASLPSSGLKGLLQRDMEHYVALFQQTVTATAAAPASDRCLAEQEYDLLLQATHATKLVEMPVTPAEVFFNYSVPTTLDASTASPTELVDAVEQICTALAHELATNGLVSALPSLQEPGHAVALYVAKLLPLLHAYLERMATRTTGFEASDRLQSLLLDTLRLVGFHRPLPTPSTPSVVAFYTPAPTTEASSSATETHALAQLYAVTLILVLFFPAPSAAVDSDDSDDDDDSTPAPTTTTPEAFVSDVLAVAYLEAKGWLVDVVLMALSLPRPASAVAAKDAPLTRLVLQALRTMSFDVGMGRQVFLTHVACLRKARAYLKTARLGQCHELSSLITQLTSLPVPFKLLDWLQLVALSALSDALRAQVQAVLATEKPISVDLLSTKWTDDDILELLEKVQSQSSVVEASADDAVDAETLAAPDADMPLFYVDSTGANN
ncbi:hypothetical protein SPRG_12019 [Saprolegnia parasitica CBS 223.65]|uniref:Uncharacterized protein n=1 Tax=Saprolegnia parasitica (strain CBS 223.65) TaxID=695850 RepID=A0A067C7U0_SAPPC|nr:hypothetical protein SPRG_12019 [Saprolegnia parasitica CBS 223.65]KDO22882.1 hypothetical protein SPRG_12019 [Saprolegnia parasitica CBS 223.65]|eukprot:XP_012206438.1 hypothetical protein SPRG_12019 [Saprolegnia parasitica CBS 223.65]